MRAIITFLLVALIVLPAHVDMNTPVTLTDAQLTMVKEAVADRLKDPESARFSRIKATGIHRPSAARHC